jgi:TPR repeat protein
MPNKSAVIFLLVLLAIIPAYAALAEEPNLAPSDTNSFQSLIDNAAKEDANAQFFLGVMYASGQGVPQDYNEAVKWFIKAAEQGLPWATIVAENILICLNYNAESNIV